MIPGRQRRGVIYEREKCLDLVSTPNGVPPLFRLTAYYIKSRSLDKMLLDSEQFKCFKGPFGDARKKWQLQR